jgi:hypothetical protein
MERLKDWNGASLVIRRSRGQQKVPYVEDWRRNVLGVNGEPPPPWLMKQVCRYVARRRWFSESDADALGALLGRISKFQSLRSEDALTWSWFGTLATASPPVRRVVVQWLYDELGLEHTASEATSIRQWPRVLHPNAPGRQGPEVDAVIDDPDGALIYVEAKWLAGLGTGRGRALEIVDDQIVLRRDSMRKDKRLPGEQRSFVVLGVSRKLPPLDVYAENDQSMRPVDIRWVTWGTLASCPHHPVGAEFERHLEWKSLHGT